MEQFIVFIIFYLIYSLFNMAVKKKRTQNQAQRKPSKSTGIPRPAGQLQEPKAETRESEIPQFLKDILGLEEPDPPSPQKQVTVTPPLPLVREEVLPKPDAQLEDKERIALKTELISKSKALLKTPKNAKSKSLVYKKLLQNKNDFRRAIVLKEILDTPLCKRSRRRPFSGEV